MKLNRAEIKVFLNFIAGAWHTFTWIVLLPPGVLHQLCNMKKSATWTLNIITISTIPPPESFDIYNSKYNVRKQYKCRCARIYCRRRQLLSPKLGTWLEKSENNSKYISSSMFSTLILEWRWTLCLWQAYLAEDLWRFNLIKQLLSIFQTLEQCIFSYINGGAEFLYSLEKNLARYTCLTRGETICIKVADRNFMLDILVKFNTDKPVGKQKM
mgnify:FL=1